MRSLRLLLGIVIAMTVLGARAQTSYSWSAYPTRCTGASVYTQPNMTVSVTGSGFSNRGPQCAASACASTAANRYVSPKYVTSPNASAPEWQATGLGLGVDWANTTTTVTVAITFTTAVCGPLTFTIYDINSGTWGGYLPVWRDRVTLSGTNDVGSPIYPSSITACSGNTVGGANSNIISAATNTGCTAGFQTITFSSPTIKTLTIVYSSLGIDPTYGTDPDPQYIIISNITTTACAPLPILLESIEIGCEERNARLNWKTSEVAMDGHFEIQKSTDGVDFHPAGRISLNTNRENRAFTWRDPDGNIVETFYRLQQIDLNGDALFTHVLAAPMGCMSGLNFSISPVPAQDQLQIFSNAMSDGEIQYAVFDTKGRKVAEWNAGLGKTTLDLHALEPGVYLLRGSKGGEAQVKRFTVVK